MKSGNRKYMEGEDFKARQTCFEFLCARAEQILKTFRDECRKGWRSLFKPATAPALSLPLPFAPFSVTLTLKEYHT